MNLRSRTISQNQEGRPADWKQGGIQREGAISKEEWIQYYTVRIFQLFQPRKTALGIAESYTLQLRRDLAQWHEDPLKRMFVEATY